MDDVRHQLRQGFAGVDAAVMVRAQQQADPGDAAKFPLLPARAGDVLHILFGDKRVVVVVPHNVAVVVAVEPVPVTLGSQKRPSNANDSNSAKALGHHKLPIRSQQPGLEPRVPHHRRQRVGGEGFHGQRCFNFNIRRNQIAVCILLAAILKQIFFCHGIHLATAESAGMLPRPKVQSRLYA